MSLSEKARIDARKRAETDLYFLVTEILEWGGDKGGPPIQPDFHRALCDWICDTPTRQPFNKTRQLLWPRYHGKTTIWTVADSIRWCLRIPDICVAIGHAKKDDAEQIVAQIRSEFENKPLLKWIAPDRCYAEPEKESPMWNQDAFVIRRRHYNKTPTFQATSPEALPTGMHFDIWTWDDLVTEKNCQTADQREKMYRAIGYASPYLPPTRLRYIKLAGTRWHIHDAYGKLIDTARKRGKEVESKVGTRVVSPRLDCLTAGMLRDKDSCWMDSRFCVEKTGDEDHRVSLQELKDEMGSSTFYACMMNDPKPDGLAVFKTADLQRYNHSGDPHADDPVRKAWSPPLEGRGWILYTSVDFNVKPDETGDHAVVLTVAKSDRNEMAVVDISRGHPTQAEIADWIEAHCRKWFPSRVFVESAGYQETFAQLLQERRIRKGIFIPYEAVPRGGRNSSSKNTRIMALQPLVESRRLWVPEGREYDPLLREMDEFAQDGKNQMDDILDCLADVFRLGNWPASPKTDERKLRTAPRQAILASQLLDLWDADRQANLMESGEEPLTL